MPLRVAAAPTPVAVRGSVWRNGAMSTAEFELVVAVAENDAIGRKNQLPWHLRGDLQHFKALTLNKSVLMGRKTFASIGHALPGRMNWVLSRDPTFEAPGCTVITNVNQAVQRGSPVMAIGGAEIYALCLARTHRMHLTLVHTVIADADRFFRSWREAQWLQTQRSDHCADAHNDFSYSLLTLERRLPA